jgi:hypothetical protein
MARREREREGGFSLAQVHKRTIDPEMRSNVDEGRENEKANESEGGACMA